MISASDRLDAVAGVDQQEDPAQRRPAGEVGAQQRLPALDHRLRRLGEAVAGQVDEVVAPSPSAKKLISCVRPGVFEARASALRPVSALIRLDLPTFERPAKQTSSRSAGGSPSIATTPLTKSQGPAKSSRPRSSASGSGSGASGEDLPSCQPHAAIADRDAAAARSPRHRPRSPGGPSRPRSAPSVSASLTPVVGIDRGRLAAGDPLAHRAASRRRAGSRGRRGRTRRTARGRRARHCRGTAPSPAACRAARRARRGSPGSGPRSTESRCRSSRRRARTTKAGRARPGSRERRHPGDQPRGVRRVVGIDGDRLAPRMGQRHPPGGLVDARRGSPSAPATSRRG